jgi:hypothetical protein
MKIKRSHEVDLFDKYFWKNTARKFAINAVVRRWFKIDANMDPLFKEIFKFKPSKEVFRYRRKFGLLGMFLGLNSYLIFNKIYHVKKLKLYNFKG